MGQTFVLRSSPAALLLIALGCQGRVSPGEGQVAAPPAAMAVPQAPLGRAGDGCHRSRDCDDGIGLICAAGRCVFPELDTPACADVDCDGHGVCVEVDGNPACACASDYVAVGLGCVYDPGDTIDDPTDLGACVPSIAQLDLVCREGNAVWLDDCGVPGVVEAVCEHGCDLGACLPPPRPVWEGVGGSDFAPWATTTAWGSAQGEGLSGGWPGGIFASLAYEPAGTLVAAFVDYGAFARQVAVRRLVDGRWSDIDAVYPSLWSSSPSLLVYGVEVDAQGRIVIALVASEQPAENLQLQLYLYRLEDGAFRELGRVVAPDGPCSGGGCMGWRLSLDPTGAPCLIGGAYSTYNVSLYRYDGAALVRLGPSLGWGMSPDLTFAADGAPVVSFSTSDRVYVRKLVGGAWTDVGTTGGAPVAQMPAGARVYETRLETTAAGDIVLVHPIQRDGITGSSVVVRRFDGSQWTTIGRAEHGGEYLHHDSSPTMGSDPLAVGADVYVARATPTGSMVSRLRDGVWSDVSMGAPGMLGVPASTTPVYGPKLLADPTQRPVFFWSAGRLFVAALDGVTWRNLDAPATAAGGAISNDASESSEPVVVLDADEQPIVAWSDMAAVDNAWRRSTYVRRFDGTAWVEMGGGSASGAGVSLTGRAYRPRLAAGANGTTVVGWHDVDPQNGSTVVMLRRFDGTTWQELSGSASGGGISGAGTVTLCDLAVDPIGNPVVAWTRWDSANARGSIHLRRFDGTSWQELAGSATAGIYGGAYVYGCAVALDADDRPWVAFSDGRTGKVQVHLARYDGVGWSGVSGSNQDGGISNTTGAAHVSRLGFDGEGRPTVAWLGAWDNPSFVITSRFDGTAWTPVTTIAAHEPRPQDRYTSARGTALDPDGEPWVAWHGREGESDEVFVARHTGDGWEEPGLEEGDPVSISNSRGPSFDPSLAVGPTRACVAWVEFGRASQDIALRCLARQP